MKVFCTPEINIEELNIADVITTSAIVCDTDCDGFTGCPNDTCLTD